MLQEGVKQWTNARRGDFSANNCLTTAQGFFFDALSPEAQRKMMDFEFKEIIESATTTARFFVELGEAQTQGNNRQLLLGLLLAALSVHISTRDKKVSAEESRMIFFNLAEKLYDTILQAKHDVGR